jgi:carboxyl-terminal processing protease
LEIPKALIHEVGYVDAYVETFHKMYEGDYVEKEILAVRKIMDSVMKDLSAMESIVIDIRFNGGGQDAVSFEIMSRFISNKMKIGTQKLRYGNTFTPILPLEIQGTENAFTKPIYVLTSQQTGSAAETFSIATMSMKHAKRIGSPTSGAILTALEKELPNGWAFAISNEICMDNEGNNYENRGIPVDYTIEYPEDRQTFFRSVVNNLDADKENILRAIEHLKDK